MPDNRLHYRPVASGMVKFRDCISAEALCVFFQERQVSFHGVTFEEMLIRKCAKDQNAVWFICRYDDGKPQPEQERKDHFNRFYEELTDVLKRQFGNDFVGWDISSNIKVVPLIHGNKAM